MKKNARKWKNHVDVVETPAPAPQYVVTPTTWQVHMSDQSPANHDGTQIRITEIHGRKVLHIDQSCETISLTEDEFEMVVQAGAQAFLQRWPQQ